MSFKKRGAIYSAVALMLCVAVYLNWSYNKTESGDKEVVLGDDDLLHGISVSASAGTADQPAESTGGYFSAARLSRDKARDEALGILNSTAESDTAPQDARNKALEAIQTMAEAAVKESRIEGLITAKGFKECVVYINTTGINVIVEKRENGLTDADAAKIKEIVKEETGISSDMIKIIENT